MRVVPVYYDKTYSKEGTQSIVEHNTEKKNVNKK